MIMPRIGGSAAIRTFELEDGYGDTAEVAQEVLTIALPAALKPVVVDQGGAIHWIPSKRLASSRSGRIVTAAETGYARARARRTLTKSQWPPDVRSPWVLSVVRRMMDVTAL